MEISFNLTDIIEKNGRVTLPGIGSFYKKRVEGFFDDARKTFFPPKETIEFSVSTQEKDLSDTISYFSNANHISETSAHTILKQYADNLKNNLTSQGKASIKDLGVLKQEGTTIVLEGKKDLQSGLLSFGLPPISITLPEVKEQPEDTKTATPNKEHSETSNKEVFPESYSLAEQALSVAVLPEEEEKTHEEPTSSKTRTWIHILLIIIVLLLGLQTLYLTRPEIIDDAVEKIQQQFMNKNEAPAAVIETEIEEIEIQKADSIYTEDIEEQLKAHGFEADKVKDSADIVVISQEKNITHIPTVRHEIIVSSWQTKSKAEEEVKKLRAKGMDAHIVEDAGGLLRYKISVATFYNQNDAKEELKRILEEASHPQAYIYSFKIQK